MPRSAITKQGEDTSRLSGSMRTLFAVGSLCGLTDGQLLEGFLQGRGDAEAEAAFTALVQRHGPMVLAACRAVLGDRHDAEDACQAAFLVLARRAGTIRRGDSVASWLYGVARRLALRARRDAARRRELERRRRERAGSTEPVAAPPPEPWPELYEELDRLPEPFRAAVVLCDLEGHSYEQAARLLHCPVGTVQSRLARGRERLRRRLERRGIAPAVALAGSGGALAARRAAAAFSPQLTAAIARSAIGIGAGRTIAAAAPAAVAAMAWAEVRRQAMTRVLTAATTLVMTGVVATAAIVVTAAGRGDDPGRQADAARNADTGPIHVRVVDLTGRGVPGIAVEVRGGDQPRSFTTDADGRAAIPRDVLGESGFLVAGRGRDALAWIATRDERPDRPAGTEDDPIVMKLLPLDHRVEGSVVDREGRPIPGIRMRVYGLAHPVQGSLQHEEDVIDERLAPAVTDRAGRFAMVLPREAEAVLRASHARYVGPVLGVVPDARVLPATTLEPAGGIAGRAIDSATGRPVAGASVAAQLAERRTRIIGGWSEATSDDRGRFLLGGLEPGVYTLLLLKVPGRPHAAARAVEGVRVRAGDDAPADVAVIEGRPLRGIVIDRDTDQPVPGDLVGYQGTARPQSGGINPSQKADAQGRFTFYVPPGEQQVYLMGMGQNGRLARRSVVVPEQGAIEPVRLLRRIIRDQDAVTKAAAPPTPAPSKAEVVEEVKAVGPPPGPPTTEVTKVAVAEEDVTTAPPSRAVGNAQVKAEEIPTVSAPTVALAPQAALPAAAVPAKVRTVTGYVRDPQGQPLAGVQVGHFSEIGGPDAELMMLEEPVTDRQGMFILPDVPQRPTKFSLARAGYRSQTVELPADRDRVEWTFGLVPDPSIKEQTAPAGDEPIPPELSDRLTFVDLQPQGTDYLADGPGYTGNDLNRLPRGIHKLGETYFRIGEKMVHVQGRTMGTNLPQSVKGIRVRARGRVLHFLHATQYGVESSDLIGAYVIHYTDGTSERIPLVCGRQLADWWGFDDAAKRQPTGAKVVWTGLNDATEMNQGLKIRLFDMAWTNPHPEKEIASLDVLSAAKDPDPFLVAVTLERP